MFIGHLLRQDPRIIVLLQGKAAVLTILPGIIAGVPACIAPGCLFRWQSGQENTIFSFFLLHDFQQVDIKTPTLPVFV